MKNLSIAILLTLLFGLVVFILKQKETYKQAITENQELKTLNKLLVNEVIILNVQKEAARNHMDHCAWIAKDQIVAVNGSHGHWLQLDLNQPGYTLK